MLQGTTLDPFRQWTPQELIAIGVSKPMLFEPGTNWGYSHTNYVILGRALEKIAGMPLAQAMRAYILGPMGLKQTQNFEGPRFRSPCCTRSVPKGAKTSASRLGSRSTKTRPSVTRRGRPPKERCKSPTSPT